MRRLRIALGVVFLVASLPKFLAYGWELDQFRRFGLPGPDPAWVIAAGVIELVGGALLLADRFVRPAAALLGATMVVAIASSGIKEGDVVPSLTVAPLCLAGCVVLLGTRRRDVRVRPAVMGTRRAMENHEQEHAPQGSGENPDVPGIDQGPGEPDREPADGGSGRSEGADSGGAAHTSADEGHPAGDGERTDREVGGPKAAEDAPDADEDAGVHGDIQTKGMPPHE